MKVRADQIYHALAKKHELLGDFFITECKSGPTTSARKGELLIFDAIAIKKSWSRPCVTIYEVKVNRQDFLSDAKWPQYKQFCNKFYFVCPVGLISSEEISNGNGLVYYNPETKALRTVRKPPMIDNPLPTNVFYYILMNRLESERHPFFSKTRDYFEAMVVEKEIKYQLGYYIKSKLLNDNKKLINELKEVQLKVGTLEKSHEELRLIREELRKHGIDFYGYRAMDNLRDGLSSKMPLKIKQAIIGLGNQIKYLKELIGED